MVTAIIVAGGSSRRMGFDKLLALVHGKPVVAHAIAAFEQTASVAEIILVGRAEILADYKNLPETHGFKKIVAVIAGGARRQDSVRRGLEEISATSDFVAVHDAARPLVSPALIERISSVALNNDGAAAAAPVIDTLKSADADLV